MPVHGIVKSPFHRRNGEGRDSGPQKTDSCFHSLLKFDSASWGKSEKSIRSHAATLATDSGGR
jgi:hypothetical protein